MPLSDYNIPSATKTVTMTETELFAIQFPERERTLIKVWKDIPGEQLLPVNRLPEGYYISNKGRLMHEVTRKSGKIVRHEIKGTYKKSFGLTALITSPLKVAVRYGRIMLEAFKPHKNSNNLQAVPLDGDNRNMDLDNWSWMSRLDAVKFRKDTGEEKPKIHSTTLKGRYGNIQKMVRYSDFESSEMKRLILAGVSSLKVAEIFGCSTSWIAQVKKKLNKITTNDKQQP